MFSQMSVVVDAHAVLERLSVLTRKLSRRPGAEARLQYCDSINNSFRLMSSAKFRRIDLSSFGCENQITCSAPSIDSKCALGSRLATCSTGQLGRISFSP